MGSVETGDETGLAVATPLPVASAVALAGRPAAARQVAPDPARAVIAAATSAKAASAGAQGPAGPPGPRGISTGFGQVRYAEAVGGAPEAVAADIRTPLAFAIDPRQTQDYLNPPFAGALGFDGTVITPRAMGDLVEIVVNLLVTSSVAGGQIKFDLDVGSPLGPTGADTASLFESAGVPERVTGRLIVQTLTNFLQNGARLYLRSSVPISLLNEAILIIPRSLYAGA